MRGFLDSLEERERMKEPVKIGLVGVGKVGRTILHQARFTLGVKVVAVAEIRLEIAKATLKNLGIEEGRYEIAKDEDSADRIVDSGNLALTTDLSSLIRMRNIDVVIDATGVIDVGAKGGYEAINLNKDYIMLNAEADATVGPILAKLAEERRVVYSGDLGDEPGTIMNYLFEPFASMGFRVIAAGKGKNNPLDVHANPESLMLEAKRKRLNPNILTSFVDGTKTMVEMTVLSNATGLLPDRRGMHGPVASVSELNSVFKLKEKGGILQQEGVVDYAVGVAPGVFIVVDIEDEELRENLAYLKVGEEPPYTFYRPYHLPGNETILTAAWVAIYRRPIIKAKGHFSDVIAVAKKDLRRGDTIDGIGGFTVYGLIDRRDTVKRDGFLPIGLSEGAIVKRHINRDEPIMIDDVELKEDRTIFSLWRLQEKVL